VSLPLLITREAEMDLAEASAWYDEKREGLDEEFVLCVEAGLDQIRRFPTIASEVFPTVRRLVVRRFPYGIFYRDASDQIAVLAVYHSQRDPRGWQERSQSMKPGRNPFTGGYFLCALCSRGLQRSKNLSSNFSIALMPSQRSTHDY
jgi:toxin ParE1/3/4